MRLVKGETARHQRAIGELYVNGHFHRHDIAELPVVLVLQRVIRIQLQLVQAEAVGHRHGMGPGHVLIETDADKGEAVQRCTGHVVLPRQGQVGLVPGACTEPGLVRVAQQQRTAVLGAVAADGQGVTAAVDVTQLRGRSCRRRGGIVEVGGADARLRSVSIGPCHRQQGAAEGAVVGAAAQGLTAQEQEQVDGIDLIDPVGVAATVVTLRQVLQAGLLEVAVHATHVTFSQVAGELRQLGNEFLFEFLLPAIEIAEQEV